MSNTSHLGLAPGRTVRRRRSEKVAATAEAKAAQSGLVMVSCCPSRSPSASTKRTPEPALILSVAIGSEQIGRVAGADAHADQIGALDNGPIHPGDDPGQQDGLPLVLGTDGLVEVSTGDGLPELDARILGLLLIGRRSRAQRRVRLTDQAVANQLDLSMRGVHPGSGR